VISIKISNLVVKDKILFTEVKDKIWLIKDHELNCKQKIKKLLALALISRKENTPLSKKH
jgi:hypothetical protein